MKIAAWTVAVAAGLALAAAGLCGVVAAGTPDRPFPLAVGNWPRQPDERHRFKVAVLGDSQKGLRNLANLLERIKAERVDFILHTGDLVSHNDDGHYRLVALVLSRARLEVPFLVVPGNHDIKGSPDRFRNKVGQLEFAFTWGKVAFIAVNNADGRPPDVAHLDRLVSHFARPDDEVVLAMHVPPFDLKGQTLPGYEAFLEWLGKSPRVRYLFSGHVHDYVRRPVGRAVVVANGVGGDSESWQFHQKVYATILEVDGANLTDRMIELSPESGFRENLEHLALGHVAEWYRAQPGLLWTATAVLFLLVPAAIFYARHLGRRAPRP